MTETATSERKVLRYTATIIVNSAENASDALTRAQALMDDIAWADADLEPHTFRIGGRHHAFYSIKEHVNLIHTLIDPINVFLGEPCRETFLARKGDIDFDKMLTRSREKKTHKSERNGATSFDDTDMLALSSWAVLDEHGWIDRRSAVDLSTWFSSFRKRIKALPDETWLVMVDCEFTRKDKL